MSSMTHKMWSQWKDFRLSEGQEAGQMAKSQLKRSVKLARMIYEIIENMEKDENGDVELHAWVQSALTISLENLQSVHTYLDGKTGIDEAQTLGYSSPEAKKLVQQDIIEMGVLFNKVSQQSIKKMLDGVKNGKYDAMDLIQGIKGGDIKDTSTGVKEMLNVLWTKVEKRFRSYLGGKKRR